ncbi:DUF2867 domain-containing protein [Arthrobacter jiangjiafuii]|uniref:DUF2867 domain-containing protein n=1 Tax=Arthrobacter jiangjiafuii TaxID=2817475 RepID=A0A975M4Q6_9MICC|nr:DUF2867 domain-containing protein [Arthrobacter jiangjiafuii]
MKHPIRERTEERWKIHGITPDFRLYGVWDLPTPGGPDDFPRLVRLFAAGDTGDNPSRIARLLFAIRWKLGALLHWDGADDGVGHRVPTLRDRLPPGLLAAPSGPAFARLPFTPSTFWKTNSLPRWRTGPSTACCTCAGWRAARALTTARWRSSSNPTDCWAGPTWQPSPRFGTSWSTRPCCGASDRNGATAPGRHERG